MNNQSEETLDKALDQYLAYSQKPQITPQNRLPHYAAAATAILAGTHTDAAIVELGPISNFGRSVKFAGWRAAEISTMRNPC